MTQQKRGLESLTNATTVSTFFALVVGKCHATDILLLYWSLIDLTSNYFATFVVKGRSPSTENHQYTLAGIAVLEHRICSE